MRRATDSRRGIPNSPRIFSSFFRTPPVFAPSIGLFACLLAQDSLYPRAAAAPPSCPLSAGVARWLSLGTSHLAPVRRGQVKLAARTAFARQPRLATPACQTSAHRSASTPLTNSSHQPRGEISNKSKFDVEGPSNYLKPCRWTTYHSPRHEMSDVSSNSRDRPVGSVKRKRERN